jgi:hypothetical protein
MPRGGEVAADKKAMDSGTPGKAFRIALYSAVYVPAGYNFFLGRPFTLEVARAGRQE